MVSMSITPISDVTTIDLLSNYRNPITMTTRCDSLTNTRVLYTERQGYGIPHIRLQSVLNYCIRTDDCNTIITAFCAVPWAPKTVPYVHFTIPTVRGVGHTTGKSALKTTSSESETGACCSRQEHDECKTRHNNQNLKEKRAYNKNIVS